MSAGAGPNGFVVAPPGDPRTLPLLAGLRREYVTRYGTQIGEQEMAGHPVEDFSPPDGGIVLLLEAGTAVAGGAFRRYDDVTAELKRLWTAPAHRRRGLSRRVLAELERQVAAAGYRRIHLTTGNRQPEARALYLGSGYTPLTGRARVLTDEVHELGFEKHLR
ncbi:GNAT family N-acetyltransferase [Kocuria sp. M1R5S2]|uniref:GNAT family N-acetyltransferase n=1 Tax=Kocuria rhizosphaerae TaxID=3376285 RepID=UPI0037ACABB0